jgi:hypothetical protein
MYHRLDKQRQCILQWRTPRYALHHPSCLEWKQLYNSRNNQAFETRTGLGYNTCKWLEVLFQPIYNYHPPWVYLDGCIAFIQQSMVCPRLIDAATCLGPCHT